MAKTTGEEPARQDRATSKPRKDARASSNTKTRNNERPSITETDIEEANENLALAFTLLGLHRDATLVCPECGADKPKKVLFKRSAKSGQLYWKCYPCGAHSDAIELLKKHQQMDFPTAVNTLLGRTNAPAVTVVIPAEDVVQTFEAVVDVEIYDAIVEAGSVEAAQKYWATWHINPDVVADSGSRMITDAKALHQMLVNRFGMERLIQAGVVTVTDGNTPYFLVNDDYPVIEVHESPTGHVVGMQFRPSPRQRVKVEAHKAWKRRWSRAATPGQSANDAWSAAYALDPANAGEKAPYVTPFLSLKGAGPDSLVGCGTLRLHTLPKGKTVFVVEGFKDLLAARSMGVEAYAIPGTGNMPPVKVCTLLRRHKVMITLDGDAAGEKGRAALLAYFQANGVNAIVKPDIRAGMDVADILVERFAHKGCTCPTCTSWRNDHPWDPASCPCVACTTTRNQ